MTDRRRNLLPWIVWGVALLAYVVAIVNRSSLSALGTTTQEHFGIDATTLATFAMIQLAVYAAMQIPVGTLLDRFGPTILILSGGVLMVAGQLAMALVHDVGLAILARVFIGAGDACVFISVMRLLPDWFSVRHLPMLGQLTGQVGQAGQLISVTPLAFAVDSLGWTTGFMGVAAAGLLTVLLGAVSLRDAPGEGTVFERMTGRVGKTSRNARPFGGPDSTALLRAVAPPATSVVARPTSANRNILGAVFIGRLRQLLGFPGVRLAYWVHFTTPFALTVFVLLWGSAFLTGGLGMTQTAASGLLSLTVIVSMVAGVLLGPITSRFVEHRVWIAVAAIMLTIAAWLLVLLWPTTPPMWVLVTLIVVLAIGGPTSLISFEIARSHAPLSLAGLSTGVVNTGGFTSALIAIFLVGYLLDLQGAGSPELYNLVAFRWAFAVLLPILALGLIFIMIEIGRTKRWMARHGRTLR